MINIDEVLDELKSMRDISESSIKEMTWDQAFVEIFNSLKTNCENEIITHKNSGTGSEMHIENFSKKILNTMVQVKKSKDNKLVGLKSNFNMLNSIIDKFTLIQKNREERPTREERNFRNTGERPKTLKEKREESKKP
jgi:hypothetical protein